MTERVADALVLAFSEGVSLRIWAESGLLDREWALYRHLEGAFGRIVVVTYGDSVDHQFRARLSGDIGLVCNSRGLSAAEYLAAIPGLVAGEVGAAATVVVKTNQMSGGEAALAIAAALRKADKRVGLVARGGYLWSQFAAWESGAASQAAVLAGEREGRLCRAADLVVGTTRQMADDLAWRHNVSEARLAVVPNYVLDEDAPVSNERSDGAILFAGRLAPQKRVDRLIEAVGRLRDDLKQRVELSIIGSGPLEDALRQQAREQGVNASFESRVPHDQLLDRMRRCCLYAQTSSYEGHPKTVIEAMSVGTPVLLTDTPGLRGIVKHGHSGLCVPTEAEAIALALEGLLDDAGWREALGAAAAAQARAQYGLEHVAEQEIAAYRRALATATQDRSEVDLTRAVKWETGLLEERTSRMVEGWERSVRGFARRLEPRRRAEFLAALDGPLYHLQGEAAAEAEGGLHPKHRLMRYHDFFTDRIRPGERVIDLGCGVGALAASIAEKSGAKVVGMDWTASNLDKARRRAADRGLDEAEFVAGDITTDRAPGSFDVVVLSNVLEHLRERPRLLRMWREWYGAPRLLIRVPAFDREWRVPWKQDLGVEWRLDVTHETEYTRAALEQELKEAGLRGSEWVTRWGEYWVVAEPA
jgi:SAM-dependent methyltransferase